MPPKQAKADIAKKQVEDKTFGLKNKNKSKNVQKYVQSLNQSVQPKVDPSKVAAKKKKEEVKAREKELNELFKVAISQPKVPPGVDPENLYFVNSSKRGSVPRASSVSSLTISISKGRARRLTFTVISVMMVRAEFGTLENMPTKAEIYAKLLGSLKSPASGLVGTLQAPARQVVMVLKAYVQKLEEAAQ